MFREDAASNCCIKPQCWRKIFNIENKCIRRKPNDIDKDIIHMVIDDNMLSLNQEFIRVTFKLENNISKLLTK